MVRHVRTDLNVFVKKLLLIRPPALCLALSVCFLCASLTNTLAVIR